MNIIKTMVTRTAEETTAHGVFNLEYTVSDNVLERISATIRKTGNDGMPGEYLGSIVYEVSSVNLNFMNMGASFAPLVEDFEQLLRTIQTNVAEQTACAE